MPTPFSNCDTNYFRQDLKMVFWYDTSWYWWTKYSLCNINSYILKKNIIGVLYRPPENYIRTFNDKLESILQKIRRENRISYMFGDFNINLLSGDYHPPTGEFLDLMWSNSFLPLITRPTRVTANSATLIDNIFTNHFDKSLQFSEGILVTDNTDQYPVFHINRQMIAMDSELYIERRLCVQRNKQAFLGAIQEIDWGETYSTPGTQSWVNGKIVSVNNFLKNLHHVNFHFIDSQQLFTYHEDFS